MSRSAQLIASWRNDRRGGAAIEFAAVGSVLALLGANVAEVGRYAFLSNEVAAATQSGAEAALVACDPAHTPATTNCPSLSSAVTTAIQGTSLASNVSLAANIAEGYYCLNTVNVLTYMGDVAHNPADCSTVGNPTLKSVLYLQIQTTYAYQPIFPGLTIANTFPANITRTSWMRIALTC